MKQLADGVWQLSRLPAERDQRLPARGRPDRRLDPLRRAAASSASSRATSSPRTPSPTRIPTTRAPATTSASAYGVPFWVGESGRRRRRDPELIGERQPGPLHGPVLLQDLHRPWPPGRPQAREGDEVAGFKVLDVPGHSAGHVAFWRESDGVLVLGDVFNNADVFTAIPG